MKYVSTPFPFIPASFHMFHSCGRSAHPGCAYGYANTSVTRFAIATRFESPWSKFIRVENGVLETWYMKKAAKCKWDADNASKSYAEGHGLYRILT